ncbi:unnamed protein product [Closterium sp. NIES-54]
MGALTRYLTSHFIIVSDHARATSPTISRLLATVLTDPSFESATASALVAELLEFSATCRLDYATALVAEFAFATPPSVGGECALGTDVLEDKKEDFKSHAAPVPRFASMLLAPEGDPDAPDITTPRSYAEVTTGPYSSQWQAAMDAEMVSLKSTGTCVDEVPPPGANIVDGMWIFKVKRPPGSPPAVKARYVARGFTFLQGSVHEEIWLRRPPGFTGSFPAGTQWSLRRLVYGLRQAPREWHDILRTTLAALGFAPSTAVSHLPVELPLLVDGPPVAQSSQLQLSSSLVDSNITAVPCSLTKPVEQLSHRGQSAATPVHPTKSSALPKRGRGQHSTPVNRAMAAQELRWLTYLLFDLGEQPRSPPVLYVDNKAMIALCQEHKLEHRTKHIALRYFLARELQHRGQLRLAYVATRANTADVFTKALPLGDHQRFSTVLGLVPTFPHLLTA